MKPGYLAVYCAGLAFIVSYLTFTLSLTYENFFYREFIFKPVVAIQAMRHEQDLAGEPYPPLYWNPSPYEETGVVTHDPARSYDGLTLFTSPTEEAAFLIDMKGEIIHKWQKKFSDIWPEPKHLRRVLPEHRIRWRGLHLYPNGDLLAIIYGIGDTPWGYGMVKLDRDSNIVWQYEGQAHHAVTVMPDGNILTMTHEIRTEIFNFLPQISPPLFEDFIVVLSPEGKELKKISIPAAFENSAAASSLRLMLRDPEQGALPPGDFLHPNSVFFIGDNVKGKNDIYNGGDVLLSLRNLSMLIVIDFETEKVTWAARGAWLKQHDAEILENGNIMVFDNMGYLGADDRARVLEFDPRTLGAIREFSGTPDNPIRSDFMSNQQVLPNGNLLIAESNNGRMIEAAPDGAIVWEYRSPSTATKEDGTVVAAAIFDAVRFAPGELTFLARGQ